jgi:predicted nicotinamide N-methyase
MTEAFVRSHTVVTHAAIVPEIPLYLATEVTPLWQATEDFLVRKNMAPPYWAFAWPGSQALARLVLDTPGLVVEKRVLDFAAGGGLAAIACALRGAAHVETAEVDPMAAVVTRMNAALSGVVVEAGARDVVGDANRWDVVMAGDVFYEAPMTNHILPWLIGLAEEGVEVLVADPDRAYLPRDRLVPMGMHAVPTSLDLENQKERIVTLYRLVGSR